MRLQRGREPWSIICQHISTRNVEILKRVKYMNIILIIKFILVLTNNFGDIYRFYPRIDRIFSGEALNPFFGAQDEGFLEFRSTFSFLTLHKCT